MKLINYFLPLLVILAIIGIGFYFYKTKNNDKTIFISPLVEGDAPKASVFSIENAPSESLRGKIATMDGEINWQDRVATEPAKISSPVTIQQGEKLITGEKSSLSLDFPNAVTIEFSPQTEVDIIQTLPKNLVFSQTSGTAQYLKTGNYPVSVRALSLLAENNGDMVIFMDPEDPIITVKQKSGNTIIAYNDLNFLSHEITIESGETLTFNYGNRRAVLR